MEIRRRLRRKITTVRARRMRPLQLDLLVETNANQLRQFGGRVRFGEEVQAAAGLEVFFEQFKAVAAGEDYFKILFVLAEFVRQFNARNLLGHHDVSKEQVDLRRTLPPDVEGLGAIASLAHFVSAFTEQTRDKLAHQFFVFNDEDGFVAAHGVARRRQAFLWFRWLFAGGQKNFKGRAAPDFAFDV